jgi:hypothetical protein
VGSDSCQITKNLCSAPPKHKSNLTRYLFCNIEHDIVTVPAHEELGVGAKPFQNTTFLSYKNESCPKTGSAVHASRPEPNCSYLILPIMRSKGGHKPDPLQEPGPSPRRQGYYL